VTTELGSPEGHLVVGRYRLFRRIGTGAMGVVWQAHDERLDRQVAVKKLLLHPALAPRKAAEAVARCLREGRIAARLHHPNAIAVFDVVDEDDMPCLVMEYMPSRSLATIMAEEEALPPVKVADVGAQVASALTAAHAAAIVHRDITPGNILLGDDGSVKLTDFGISRATDDVTATKSGHFAGTPAYLAPEVALGADPTSASDVFSLGSTLYAAVEGEPPFGRAANTLGVLHAVAGGKIKPPSHPGPLADVLVALLERDPNSRPTAAEARDLLASVGEGDGPWPMVPAPTDRTTVDITPVRRRSHRPLAVAGAFAVGLAAAGIWLMGGGDGSVPADERGPANGGSVPSDIAPGSVSEQPVAPVRAGKSKGTAEQPVTSTAADTPAAETTAPETSPAETSTEAAPPTTTENVQEPTSDTSTPPPADDAEETPTDPETPAAE
jgi:eukaryotic-like serine/threonine-protein kinase